MLIRSMTAAFGRLRQETLRLQKGLNIIQAPNETGKSTWCAFLAAMLYGINSRERDRAGFIADKNRYAPWDGAPMAGRLHCVTEDAELVITRNTRRQTAPMADFQALYAGTGTPAEGLTGANCGEALLGVSREVFERSAFIRQSGLAISQDAGLERRVAALISSGEEDTSYTEAYDALKKQLNRRRFNKSGHLPALEAERAGIQRQLEEAQQVQSLLRDALAQAETLAQAQEALTQELSRHDQYEAQQKRRQLSQFTADAQEADRRVRALELDLETDRIPDADTIGRLRGAIVNLETVRKSVSKAREEKDEAMKALLRADKAVNDSPFAGQTPEEARKEADTPPKVSFNVFPSLAVFFIMLVIAAGTTGFAFSRYSIYLTGWMRAIPWMIFAVITAAAVIVSHQMRCHAVSTAQNAALQKRFGTADMTEITALADTYLKLAETRDAAQAEVNAKTATADALYASLTTNEQAILLEVRRFAPAAFDIPTADQVLRHAAQRRKALTEAQAAAAEARTRQEFLQRQGITSFGHEELLPPPARDRAETAAELARVQAQLSAAQSTADRLSGQLHAMGDPAELESSAEALTEQICRTQEEYDALRLAMDTLDHANTAIQNRFSPQLSRRTAEIFRELTDGRYTGAALDRSFHLTAQPAGDLMDRDIQLLSAGAADQLYLAARLAICQLVLPPEKEVPIILDDALANFDDTRCAAALRWLKEESRNRQILLFTCHSREAAFFAGDPEVSIQCSTPSGAGC